MPPNRRRPFRLPEWLLRPGGSSKNGITGKPKGPAPKTKPFRYGRGLYGETPILSEEDKKLTIRELQNKVKSKFIWKVKPPEKLIKEDLAETIAREQQAKQRVPKHHKESFSWVDSVRLNGKRKMHVQNPESVGWFKSYRALKQQKMAEN